MALIPNIGHRHATRAPRHSATRLLLRSAIIVAVMTIPALFDGAGAAVSTPVVTQASLSLDLSTPNGDVGTFATTQSAPAAVDANGTSTVHGSDVTFAPVTVTLDKTSSSRSSSYPRPTS